MGREFLHERTAAFSWPERLATLVLLLTWLATGQIAQAQEPDDAKPANHDTANLNTAEEMTFAIDPHSGATLLEVTCGQTTGTYFLDSGSSSHILDDRYVPILGKPISRNTVSTADQPIQVDAYSPPEMLLKGRSIVGGDSVLATDLEFVSELLGQDIHGVIGVPFFEQFIVQFDFDKRQIRLLDRNVTPQEAWGTKFALYEGESGTRWITIEDLNAKFLIDTGKSGSISLQENWYESLRWSGRIVSRSVVDVYTASGAVKKIEGRLNSLQLGPFENQMLMVTGSRSNSIGLGYLDRFHVTMDFARNQIYLKPSKSFDTKCHDAESGLAALWKQNRLVVEHVGEHSPAERAGIVVGDVVVAVNGIPASGKNLSQLQSELVGEHGTETSVSIRQGEETQVVKFQLEEYLRWPGSESPEAAVASFKAAEESAEDASKAVIAYEQARAEAASDESWAAMEESKANVARARQAFENADAADKEKALDEWLKQTDKFIEQSRETLERSKEKLRQTQDFLDQPR